MGRPLDHVFDDVGMVLGSIEGRFRRILDTQREPAQNNENLNVAAIYCTSGMSQIPKTMLFLNMFTLFLVAFVQGTALGPTFRRFW